MFGETGRIKQFAWLCFSNKLQTYALPNALRKRDLQEKTEFISSMFLLMMWLLRVAMPSLKGHMERSRRELGTHPSLQCNLHPLATPLRGVAGECDAHRDEGAR